MNVFQQMQHGAERKAIPAAKHGRKSRPRSPALEEKAISGKGAPRAPDKERLDIPRRNIFFFHNGRD